MLGAPAVAGGGSREPGRTAGAAGPPLQGAGRGATTLAAQPQAKDLGQHGDGSRPAV